MSEASQASDSSEAGEQTSMADIAAGVSEEAAKKETDDKVVEPTNVEDFKQFAEKFTALENQVNTNTEITESLKNDRQAESLNAEIKAAAQTINENVDESMLDMAELYLEAEYRKNPDLKKIWDNRANNPEALKKALGMLEGEWKAKNDTMVDPQVRENQRALKESQKAGSSVQDKSQDDEFNAMSDAKFMREMRTIARMG